VLELLHVAPLDQLSVLSQKIAPLKDRPPTRGRAGERMGSRSAFLYPLPHPGSVFGILALGSGATRVSEMRNADLLGDCRGPDAQRQFERKTERQNWRHRFRITERSGHQSFFELRREELAGSGTTAIRRLMKAGVHVVRRKAVPEALAGFLYFKPKREIIRMSRVGWAQVGDQFTRALALIAALPPSPALRGEEIKLQVALLHPLIHVRGHAAPETKLAAQRAHLLIQQAEALGEPPEDDITERRSQRSITTPPLTIVSFSRG
jgi:hypothetical protein